MSIYLNCFFSQKNYFKEKKKFQKNFFLMGIHYFSTPNSALYLDGFGEATVIVEKNF